MNAAATATVTHRWPPIALAAAGLAAAALVAVALWLRVAIELPETDPLPQRLVPVLVALAALCAVGLLIPRAPRAAWTASAAAAGVAAVEILAVCRALVWEAGPQEAPPIVLAAGVAGSTAALIALVYAGGSRSTGEWRVVAYGIAVIVCAAVVVDVVAIAAAVGWSWGADPAAVNRDIGPLRAMHRLLLGSAALGITIGLIRDLGNAMARARRSIRAGTAPDSVSPFLGALADELLPIRRRERARAAESERARLAADLHATVLPDLRQAAAAAAMGAPPAEVAAGLRRGLEGIERLMHERQSIVLEEFGLVAALEWLAERTEERSGLVVELELEGDRVADRDAVSPAAARAAFRIALLALDNVVRHAEAHRATVRLSRRDGVIALEIDDDGARAWEPAAAHVGRGLADMRRESAAIGGHLEVVSGAGGTSIGIAWAAVPVAAHSATHDVEAAARPDGAGR